MVRRQPHHHAVAVARTQGSPISPLDLVSTPRRCRDLCCGIQMYSVAYATIAVSAGAAVEGFRRLAKSLPVRIALCALRNIGIVTRQFYGLGRSVTPWRKFSTATAS